MEFKFVISIIILGLVFLQSGLEIASTNWVDTQKTRSLSNKHVPQWAKEDAAIHLITAELFQHSEKWWIEYIKANNTFILPVEFGFRELDYVSPDAIFRTMLNS